MIIDAHPLHHRRRSSKLIESLKSLAEATLQSRSLYDSIKLELNKSKSPVYAKQLANQLNASPGEISRACLESGDRSIIVFQGIADNILVESVLHDDLSNEILEDLGAYHKTHYLTEQGLETIELGGKLGITSNDAGKEYLQAVLNVMQNEGKISKVGKSWARSDHKTVPDNKDIKDLEWLEDTVKAYDRQVPVGKEIETRSLSRRINKEKLTMFLRHLVDKGKLHVISGEYFHKDCIDRTRKQMLSAIHEKGQGITEKEFRSATGSTKSFSKAALRIFVEEKIITQSEFHIHMTETGKNLISDPR
jgi:hypothetical protein